MEKPACWLKGSPVRNPSVMTPWRAASVALLLICTGYSLADSVPGGIHVLPIPDNVAWVSYTGRPVLMRRGKAYVGINIAATPGSHQVQIHGETSTTVEFAVLAKTYPEQRLTITNPKMVNPDPADLKRIELEAARMEQVYVSFSAGPAPTRLDKPLNGRTSSPFGFRRVFNGEPRNPHSGLDLAAPTGTPVKAPAPGTVVLTGSFYFNGNSVFLDHGQGLISMVCHLSQINVKEGARVRAGEILGLVGATGRATGPHLHWSVSMNGNRVDPVIAMAVFASPE
jgi:murein DD-endopeptidase MepM/ murein hydrolase activator NlpD